MMKYLLIILATLLLPIKASAEEPITLRYGFPAGTEITYKAQTASVSRFRGFTGEEQELSGRIIQTACYRLLDTSPEGEMTWEQEVLSGTVKISAGAETRENDLPKGKLRFRLSPLGKITLLPRENGQNANLSGFSGDTLDLDLLLAAVFLPLPQAPVKPGDSWEGEIPVSFAPMPGATPTSPENQTLKAKSKLLEFTVLGKKSCAKIHTDLSLPFSHSLARPDAFPLNLTGKLTADIVWYFAASSSRTLSAAGSLQIITELSPAEGQADFRSTVSIKSNTKTTLLE